MRRLLALWVLGLGALAQVPVGQVATRDVHALLWLPDGRLLFGHHDGIHVSEDEGRTWQDLVRQMGFDAMGLVLEGNRILAAGHWCLRRAKKGARPGGTCAPRGFPPWTFTAMRPREGSTWPSRPPTATSSAKTVGKSSSPPPLRGFPRRTWRPWSSRGGPFTWPPWARASTKAQTAARPSPRCRPRKRRSTPWRWGWGPLPGRQTGLWQRTPVGWKKLWQGTVLALAAHPQEAGRLVFIDGQGRVWKLP